MRIGSQKQKEEGERTYKKACSIFSFTFMEEAHHKMGSEILSRHLHAKKRVSQGRFGKIKSGKKERPDIERCLDREKEAKGEDSCRRDFEAEKERELELVMESPLYRALNEQYIRAKKQHIKAKGSIIQSLREQSRYIKKQKVQLQRLIVIRKALEEEVDELRQGLNDIQLQNYDLRCELYDERGFGEYGFYQSEREMTLEGMSYEGILELQERMGDVDVGLTQKQIDELEIDIYELGEGAGEKCCICFEEIEQGIQVIQTSCRHLFHKVCLHKWLKIRSQCPLCRQQLGHK